MSPQPLDDDQLWSELVRAQGLTIDDAARARLRASVHRVAAAADAFDGGPVVDGPADHAVVAVAVMSASRTPRRARWGVLAAAAFVVVALMSVWARRAGDGSPRPGVPAATTNHEQAAPPPVPPPTSAPARTVGDEPVDNPGVEVDLGPVGGYPDLGFGGFGWRFAEADGIGLEVDGGEAYGPEGFGVDAAGTVYVLDAVNHNVRVVADGSDEAVPLPAELADVRVAAFAVAPDGTQYVTFVDGAAAFRGEQLLGRVDAAELGWSGSAVDIGADDHGMWARQVDGSWVLEMLRDGSLAPPGITSAADSAPGIDPSRAVAVEWSRDDLVLHTADGFAGPIRVTAEPRLSVVHAATRVGDDVLLVAGADVPTSVSQRLVIVLIRPDGTYARGYAFPPEGTTTAVGPYVEVAGRTVYLESADSEMLSIARISLDELVAGG